MVKNPPANAGDVRDVGSIPESGRSPGGGHGNPLQYSCLENPMVSGVWWARINWIANCWTQMKQFSMHPHIHLLTCNYVPMTILGTWNAVLNETVENVYHPGVFTYFTIFLASQSSPINENKSSAITGIMSILFNAVSVVPRKMLARSGILTNTSCCLLILFFRIKKQLWSKLY